MVNVAFHIRCQDDQTVVIFNSLKQIRDFLVAIAIAPLRWEAKYNGVQDR